MTSYKEFDYEITEIGDVFKVLVYNAGGEAVRVTKPEQYQSSAREAREWAKATINELVEQGMTPYSAFVR